MMTLLAPKDAKQTCYYCKGSTRTVKALRCHGKGEMVDQIIDCENCNGRGTVPHSNCGVLRYDCEYGYIKGTSLTDIPFITEFVIFPEFRQLGYARKLAEHLPPHCQLIAQPRFNSDGPHITKEALQWFYESIGFVLTPDKYGNALMTR